MYCFYFVLFQPSLIMFPGLCTMPTCINVTGPEIGWCPRDHSQTVSCTSAIYDERFVHTPLDCTEQDPLRKKATSKNENQQVRLECPTFQCMHVPRWASQPTPASRLNHWFAVI